MSVRVIDVAPGDKWVFPGDIHFDQQDNDALNVMTEVMAGEGVNGMCQIGDTMNSIGLSRHKPLLAARHYRKGESTVKSEHAAAEPFFRAWRSLVEVRRRLRPPQRRRSGRG